MDKIRRLVVGLAAVFAVSAAGIAAAQEYPAKPIKLILRECKCIAERS